MGSARAGAGGGADPGLRTVGGAGADPGPRTVSGAGADRDQGDVRLVEADFNGAVATTEFRWNTFVKIGILHVWLSTCPSRVSVNIRHLSIRKNSNPARKAHGSYSVCLN